MIFSELIASMNQSNAFLKKIVLSQTQVDLAPLIDVREEERIGERKESEGEKKESGEGERAHEVRLFYFLF